MTNFANELKNLRIERRMKQKELGDKLGVEAKQISRLETGYCEPNLEMLIKIADYFQVSVDYLLGRESEDGVIILDTESRPTREIDVIYDKLTILNQGIAIGYLRKLLEEQQAAF